MFGCGDFSQGYNTQLVQGQRCLFASAHQSLESNYEG